MKGSLQQKARQKPGFLFWGTHVNFENPSTGGFSWRDLGRSEKLTKLSADAGDEF
jgi:hypothetical protein